MRTESRSRRLLAGLFVALLLGGGAAVAPAPAQAAPSTEAMTRNQTIVVRQINASRANNGRRGIATNGLMNKKANKWARHLANCQCLEHRAAPYGVPPGWCAAAENVGRSGDGGTLGRVHQAFMGSSGHRANILRRGWSDLGVGVAKDARGEYFVVHVFADYSC